MNSTSLKNRLRPTGHDLVDIGFASVLTVLGVVGFLTVFSGNDALVVGIPATILGAALALVLVKLRVPVLAGAGAAVVVFFLFGGPIALRHRAIGGVLPSLDAFTGLADGMINGWIRLLTTMPPMGRSGDLLAIPYLCGFAGGLVAVVLAIRYPRRTFCVIPPIVIIGVSVLMGTKRPASLLLQGVVFAALTIAWVSVRDQRSRAVNPANLAPSRLATAVTFLVVSAASGIVVGPLLPGAATSDRYVLRDDVTPPFNPLTEPSPLASYRNYTDQDVRDDPVITVSGLPAKGRIRIASMDDYSGTVWKATGDGSPLAGEYLRVGDEIPSEGNGSERTVSVTVHKPEGVWVPLGGDVTGIDFQGSKDRRETLDSDVRVDVETDTAAVPNRLRKGDRYRFTAEFVEAPNPDQLVGATLDGRYKRNPKEVPAEYVSRGAEWASDQPGPVAEVVAIAKGLQTEGAFTDGGEDANPVSPPGHGLRRLLDFIDIEQPFGNGEQFAAAQGLLAQSRTVPVRVVMGFVNPTSAQTITFRGRDLQAWIEIPVEGYGWVPIDGTPPKDKLPDPMKQPRSKTDNPEPQPPPPTTVPPPTSIPDELKPEPPEEEEKDEAADEGIPGWVIVGAAGIGIPLVVLGTAAAVILGLKRRRRNRRRNRGTPATRLAGSFDELVDFTRDLGGPVPPLATRKEKALVVGGPSAQGLARHADDAVFGAAEPTDRDIDAAWAEFEATRSAKVAELDRPARVRTALSLTSLRPPR